MLVYIIDGFNLIHKVSQLKISPQPHLDLIQYIRKNKFTGSRVNRVIIVFDGGISWPAKQEKEFEIIFGCGRSADDIIKQKVSSIKNKSQVLVVSDDYEIRRDIKAQGARSLPIADFVKRKIKTQDLQDEQISYSLQKEITDELRSELTERMKNREI